MRSPVAVKATPGTTISSISEGEHNSAPSPGSSTERAYDLRRGVIAKEAHRIALNTRHNHPFSQLQPARNHPLGGRFIGQGAIKRHDLGAAKLLTLFHLPKNTLRGRLAHPMIKRPIALSHRTTNLAFIHLYTYF